MIFLSPKIPVIDIAVQVRLRNFIEISEAEIIRLGLVKFQLIIIRYILFLVL